MINQIWERLNTFSDEALQAAAAKARELNLDLNRGVDLTPKIWT